MRLLALLFVFLAFNVSAADLVLRDQAGNVVKLHETDCKQPWMKKWKQATFEYEKKIFQACWRLVGSTVVVMDSAGDVTPLPAQAFMRESGV